MKYFPALVSGLCMSFAFPVVNFSYLAFAALVPLLFLIRRSTLKDAFIAGFLTGLCHFVTLIYWIVPTVHVYGGLHPILAVSTLVLLCGYLALYPALFAAGVKKLRPDAWYTPLLAAGLWTGLEYVRANAFTGFGWGTLGYSQYLNLHLIQIADITGVYGISFLIVLVNVAVASFQSALEEKTPKPYVTVMYTMLLLAGVLGYGQWRAEQIRQAAAVAPKAGISVVQGNIRQDLKWNNEFKNSTLDKYISLSESVLSDVPDLVIWPETALPFYYGADRLQPRPPSGQHLSERVDAFARMSQTPLLFGSPAYSMEKEQTFFFNRAYLLNRFSIVTGTYDKTRLVPFGEYVPLGRYLTFLGKITAQAGNFSPGDGRYAPLEFKENKTGMLICFEILFPSASAAFTRNGADILTTITNDAWFGRTSAPQQHFAIAVFRAVENRRAVARAANTGISGFVSPTGRIMETTKLFEDTALTQRLPLLKEITVYTAGGDWFAVICLVAICLVFMLKRATTNVRKKR